MQNTLARLHHANLSHLRTLGFKTVMRRMPDGTYGHAAIRANGARSTIVLLPTVRHGGMISDLSREPGGRVQSHATLFSVDPLCLTAAVQTVLDGGDTDRMHNQHCTCLVG